MAVEPSEVTLRGALPYPDHDQPPGWLDHYIRRLAEATDKVVVNKYATATARDDAFTASGGPAAGDLCWRSDDGVLEIYHAAAWHQIWPVDLPTITAGTDAPAGGVDGDIYFRYV